MQATLREAPLQKVVLGLGLSTDQGPRASLEHRHLQASGLGGRLDSRIELQRRTPSLQTEWLDLPDAQGWRRGLLLRAERQRDGELRTDGLRLRAGRLLTGERIDRNAYLQFDQATVKGPSLAADSDHGDGRAVTANYAWTSRRFDELPDARRGFGLGLELGLGLTLLGRSQPFQRTYVRGLWLHPLGRDEAADASASADTGMGTGTGAAAEPASKSGRARVPLVGGSRLQLRAETGAVFAATDARVPATALFRTGGEPQRHRVRLADLMQQLPVQGLALNVDGDNPLHAHIDPDLVAGALLNLLDNSVRHGAQHAALRWRAPTPGELVLSLTDDGPGVPTQDVDRLNQALQHQQYEQNMGLGLMLADRVGRAHQGHLRVLPMDSGFGVELTLQADCT